MAELGQYDLPVLDGGNHAACRATYGRDLIRKGLERLVGRVSHRHEVIQGIIDLVSAGSPAGRELLKDSDAFRDERRESA